MMGKHRGLRAAAEEAAQQGRRLEGKILGGRGMPHFAVEQLGHRAQRTRGRRRLASVIRASAGVSRTTEMKRAASSEWPPRSVKKSASKGIACGGSTLLGGREEVRLGLARAALPARSLDIDRGASSICFRLLRSILPEESLRQDFDDARTEPEPYRRATFARSRCAKPLDVDFAS